MHMGMAYLRQLICEAKLIFSQFSHPSLHSEVVSTLTCQVHGPGMYLGLTMWHSGRVVVDHPRSWFKSVNKFHIELSY